MKSEHQIRVENFMKRALQDLPPKPFMPNVDIRMLRARLIMEEALETIQALGVEVIVDTPYANVVVEFQKLRFGLGLIPNMVEIVDGCCDLRVVTTGTLSALGVEDESVQRIVDQSNLKKFAPGGHMNLATGKWIKPPGFVGPQTAIAQELQQQANK